MTGLDATLQALVERPEEHGDWDDVLRRAGVSPARAQQPLPASPERSRRRPVAALVVVVLVALAVGLAATPAFGLRDAVLSLIDRSDVEFDEGTPAPGVVRWRFEELDVGAPPGMAAQALAAETRQAGTLRVHGRDRALWVAPTKRGGFCYQLEESYGGCLRNDATPLPPLVVATSWAPPKINHVSGNTLSDRIQRVSIEFRDGHAVDVPFLVVSPPIDAGFFAYDVPADRQSEERGPKAVVARDSAGEVVHRFVLPVPPTRPAVRRQPGPATPRGPLPTEPRVPPSAPRQEATGDGVTVVAGRNGVVVFDTSGMDASRAGLLVDRDVGWGCFRVVTRGRTLRIRGYAVTGRFAGRATARYFGVGTPFDGCELQGTYGHRWPDRLDSHSAAEIAFTAAGGRYFANRAAARDLALFVRSRRVQEIRRLEGDALVAELENAYGGSIVRLEARTAAPPAGRIGYWVGDGGAVFVRVSSTGRRFQVVTRAGRIQSQNLGPFAFVF